MFIPVAPYEHSLQAYAARAPTPYRSLLFTRAQQGKVAELRLELASSGGKKDKNFSSKKIALKKIVANMTMSNNDMVALFPDIVACMGIESLEIKKMWVKSNTGCANVSGGKGKGCADESIAGATCISSTTHDQNQNWR